jgi:hypothetical protein
MIVRISRAKVGHRQDPIQANSPTSTGWAVCFGKPQRAMPWRCRALKLPSGVVVTVTNGCDSDQAVRPVRLKLLATVSSPCRGLRRFHATAITPANHTTPCRAAAINDPAALPRGDVAKLWWLERMHFGPSALTVTNPNGQCHLRRPLHRLRTDSRQQWKRHLEANPSLVRTIRRRRRATMKLCDQLDNMQAEPEMAVLRIGVLARSDNRGE